MNTALWIATIALAFVAFSAGAVKAFVPVTRLAAAPGSGWTGEAGPGLVKTLGVVELLAAAGLILPAVVGIAPVLVPVTATCWVALMIGAIVTHLRHHDGGIFVLVTFSYAVLAAFVAWGRFGPEPFSV